MIAEAEIWQVMCGHEIYQADLDTLKQWVVEGLVLPTDQVRKGNLRWLDAARVPALRPVFAGEETPAPSAPPAHAAPAHAAPPPQPQHAQSPPPHAPQYPQHQTPPHATPPQQYATPPQQYAQAYDAQGAPAGVDVVYHVSPVEEPAHFVEPSHFVDPSPFGEPAQYVDPPHFAAAPDASFHNAAHGGAYAGFGAPPPAGDYFQQPPADVYFQQPPPADFAAGAQAPFVPDVKDFAARAAAAPSLAALGTACYNHPSVQPKYVCRVCQTPMCADCPKYAGASRVPLCPLCGDLCNVYEEVRRKATRSVEKSSGFGFGDLGRAALYPLRNVVGLVGISVVYSLLSLGGLKGQVLAYVVIFGCMSLVIKQMAWGRFDRGFLPDFSAMSLWDDLAVPCFLGLGISLVTIGPAVLLFLALLFGVVGGGPSAAEQQAAEVRARQEQMAAHAERVTDPDATQEEVEESLAAIQGQRRAMPGADEAAAESNAGLVRSIVTSTGGSVLIVLALLLALVWAFFYYPMALIVAGYTEDVWAVVNPLVGLDTIRRMGWNYVKAFVMYAGVQVVAAVFGFISMIAFAAFDMPIVGNIPARFVEGGFHFYASLVIAAVLGLALYKSADRLGIETD